MSLLFLKKSQIFQNSKIFLNYPKIIVLREELGGFKEPKYLTQLPEITNPEWEEWKEEGIIFSIK